LLDIKNLDMYEVAFLKPFCGYDFFAEHLSCVEGLNIDIVKFNYTELSKFNVYDNDLIIIGLDEDNLADIEIFLKNIDLFFSGVILVVDLKFNMKNKFILSELGINNYFYLPISIEDFVSYLPWYIDKNSENVIKYKDITLNMDSRSIQRGGGWLTLKNMEFRLIRYLMLNKCKILSKDRILSEVWDMNSLISSKTVEVHMCRLRNKIDRDFDDKLLHTIPNTGYMLK
jgi:DNA-binding response OmpR family regulator